MKEGLDRELKGQGSKVGVDVAGSDLMKKVKNGIREVKV